MNSIIQCEWIYMESVNYSMQQNNSPIVRKLVITNLSKELLQQVTIEITCEPEFAYNWKQTVDLLPPGQSLELGPIFMSMSASLLAQLTERVNGHIKLNIYSGEQMLYEKRDTIAILSFDEWSGTAVLPELTAAFVVPNHPHISSIIRDAARLLEEWTQSSAFDAYQSKDSNRVRLQAAAIYEVIGSQGFIYNVAPPSFEQVGQRVRLPEAILSYKMGNCLDLTLFYAACLEAVGLHPIVIFTRGHAFAGVWLVEDTFAEIVQDDPSLLTKRLSAGINELEVIESTLMTGSTPASFDAAALLGAEHLQKIEEFECFLDIKRARFSGIRPLPIRTMTDKGWVIEEAHPLEIIGAVAPTMHAHITKPLEVDVAPISTRQQQWERKLLDLTLRNTLLNFRLSKSSISVMSSELGDLEDALAEREEFQLLARPEEWPEPIVEAIRNHQAAPSNISSLLKQEFVMKRLRSDLTSAELEKRLIHLYRSARTSLEENGANSLYLALGLLKWYETPASQLPRYAPIVLIPVDLIRRTSRQGYVVRARDEEPLMNITLLEMLKHDFGITITGLDPLPRDEKGVALKQVFHTLRHALLQVARWDVIEKAHLGLFSFGQFVMWNDLRTRSNELAQNEIVASLMDGRLKGLSSIEEMASLDDIHPTELIMPLSADSSQLAAVQAAAMGESFVLHGPPGTGKSQTITNMIANALAAGKKVLFVAEKMAALSVVERRLEQIGIGQFCLELHSNKSTKRAVLEQLEAAMQATQLQRPNAWKNEADRLHALREELNNYVDGLHEQRASGYSLYDAICSYEQLDSNVEPVGFTSDSYALMTEEHIVKWRDIVAQLQVAAGQITAAYQHPLSEVRQTEYTPQLKADVVLALQDYIAGLGQFRNDLQIVIDWLNIETMDSHREHDRQGANNRLEADENDEVNDSTVANSKLEPSRTFGKQQTELFIEINNLLLLTPKITEGLLQVQSIQTTIELARSAAEQGRKRDIVRTEAMLWFLPEALSFAVTELQREWIKSELTWLVPKWFAQQRILKVFKSVIKADQNVSKDQVPHLLQTLIKWQEEELKLKEFEVKLKPLFGAFLWNEQGDWQAIEDACAWLEQLQHLLTRWHVEPEKATKTRVELASKFLSIRENEEFKGILKRLQMSHQQHAEQEQRVSTLLNINFSVMQADSQKIDWSELRTEKAKQWLSSIDSLRDWCSWRRIRESALESGLAALIEHYEAGKWESSKIKSAFERGLFIGIVNGALGEDVRLKGFSGHLFEETITRFKQADQRYTELTIQEITARLSARVPQMSQEAAQSSEAGILQRAIRSGGRGISIRRLFEMIPNLLGRLTPCMLMSPISVAQYLDPAYAKFDLVIFDEASQVPTSQAVGALARGTQAVIVGDPKQLPPTSFFSRSGSEGDDDDALLQDMESILDDCLAMSMPERHLLWHYRSRHESLIAFSNSHYYGNKLLTFPSPNEPISSVVFHPIEGYYDRGRTKVNRAEAEAVIQEIKRRLLDEHMRQFSIGVVTFSSVQQTFIEDMLDQMLQQQPELELLMQELPEPIFIKNLENVQGDERDVIMFSIGYGPDQAGKVTLNFGPLNRDGGWRRLNVAISRARVEMHVFSTLRSSQLPLGRISAEGVIGLKQFLEYAEKGKQALPLSVEDSKLTIASALHKSIAHELEQRGWKTVLNVGTSGYRIDIAIVDEHAPNQYVLGIVLDGVMYRAAQSARDRAVLREQVLRQLGWKLMHVWSADWWENRSAVIASIQHQIELSKVKLEQADREGAVEHFAGVIEGEPLVGVMETSKGTSNINYKVCELPVIGLGADQYLSQQSTPTIINQIKQVVEEEGPISKALLGKRLLQSWGIARMGSKLERRYNELLDRLQLQYSRSMDDTVFYWPTELSRTELTTYRIAQLDSERRNAEDLPPEEIAVAVVALLQEQISMPRTELVRQTAKRLGYNRVGVSLEKVISNGIDVAVQSGKAEEQNERIVIM